MQTQASKNVHGTCNEGINICQYLWQVLITSKWQTSKEPNQIEAWVEEWGGYHRYGGITVSVLSILNLLHPLSIRFYKAYEGVNYESSHCPKNSSFRARHSKYGAWTAGQDKIQKALRILFIDGSLAQRGLLTMKKWSKKWLIKHQYQECPE